MTKTPSNTKSASNTKPGWILTYRKTGVTRRFPTLQAARRANVRASARYGTRWLSLKPERT